MKNWGRIVWSRTGLGQERLKITLITMIYHDVSDCTVTFVCLMKIRKFKTEVRWCAPVLTYFVIKKYFSLYAHTLVCCNQIWLHKIHRLFGSPSLTIYCLIDNLLFFIMSVCVRGRFNLSNLTISKIADKLLNLYLSDLMPWPLQFLKYLDLGHSL